MKQAVMVVCDSLRRDLITAANAPFLSALGRRAAQFVEHRGVFPSTTRTSAASIATGCLPAQHGLLGNTMALDEGAGLVCLSVGKPDFRDRLQRATGRTLNRPTLAERLAAARMSAIAFSNVSPGAAYFLDPDGYGWVYNAAGSFGPGRRPLPSAEGLAVGKGEAGDAAVTDRFCEEVLRRRSPDLAVLWLSEPDYTGHHAPLGSPGHRRAIAAADRCVRQVADTVAALDPGGERILLLVGSDHGMESVDRTIDLDARLIAAGLKAAPGSPDVVIAPNGTAALLYFAEPQGPLVGRVARFLEGEDWVGSVFAGAALATVGLPTGTALQIAAASRPDDRANPHDVKGHSHIVLDALEPRDFTGCGQHGGLGGNEQSPFLFATGGGFEAVTCAEPTSLVDIAPTVLRHLEVAASGLDGRPLPGGPA